MSPGISDAFANSFLPATHKDVYPAISAAHDLAGTARGLSVLITGAGRGIGRAISFAFAHAGAAKLVLASQSATELDEVEQTVRALGTKEVVKVIADVTILESVRHLFDIAGEVNVLVNNAGTCETFGPIDQTDPDEWWTTFEVNIKGVYLMAREALKRSVSRVPRDVPLDLTIINISSAAGFHTFLGSSAYPITKTAVNRFTEFIDLEYGARDVRAFALHPGAIPTKLSIDKLPQEMQHFLQDTCELAAGMVLWLAVRGDTVDFLKGRYISSNWDVTELLTKKCEIKDKGLLHTKVPGA